MGLITPWWRETQALSASALQLTPQADERGIRLKSLRALALSFAPSLVLVVPATASAQKPASDASGGAAFQEPTPPPPPPADITVPGTVAQLLPDGSAAAPADAPAAVQQAIFTANKIQSKPYIYGGGHRKFEDKG